MSSDKIRCSVQTGAAYFTVSTPGQHRSIELPALLRKVNRTVSEGSSLMRRINKNCLLSSLYLSLCLCLYISLSLWFSVSLFLSPLIHTKHVSWQNTESITWQLPKGTRACIPRELPFHCARSSATECPFCKLQGSQDTFFKDKLPLVSHSMLKNIMLMLLKVYIDNRFKNDTNKMQKSKGVTLTTMSWSDSLCSNSAQK